MLCQHVMVAADSQTNTSVPPVCHLGIGKGIKIQVYNIVQRPDRAGYDLLHLPAPCDINVPQTKTGQITNHKFSGPGSVHDHRIPVLVHDFRGYCFNGLHILGNLSAKIGAIDHSLMAVGVCAVYQVPVKSKGSPCLHRRLEDHPYHIF